MRVSVSLLFLPALVESFVPHQRVLFGTRMISRLTMVAADPLPAFPSSPEQPRPELLQSDQVLEAQECLQKIQESAVLAREYLELYDEVAQAVRSYLGGDQSPLPGEVPTLNSMDEASEYLENIEKASAAAKDYLNYLEEMASSVKVLLGDKDSNSKAQSGESAQEQLSQIQSEAQVVQQILDPEVPPAQPLPAIDTTAQEVASAPAAGASYLDSLTSAPVEKATGSGTASYLESMSQPTKTRRVKGGGPTSYLDSMSSPSSTSARVNGGGGPTSYLDTMSSKQPETPTHHFKGIADSTPYSEAGPPEKGRSDVSHMDRMPESKPTIPAPVAPAKEPSFRTPESSFHITPPSQPAPLGVQPVKAKQAMPARTSVPAQKVAKPVAAQAPPAQTSAPPVAAQTQAPQQTQAPPQSSEAQTRKRRQMLQKFTPFDQQPRGRWFEVASVSALSRGFRSHVEDQTIIEDE